MKILILNPILKNTEVSESHGQKLFLEDMTRIVSQDVELKSLYLDRGAATIESFYDEYVGMTDLLDKALESERFGYDAVVINCFMNPGLEGLRELLEIPVVGAGEAALYVASMLGDNFSIIDPDPFPRSYSHKIADSLGLRHKLNSVQYLDLGVSGLSEDFDAVLNRMIKLADKAVKEDGAHVIVLGCTGMASYAVKLAQRMNEYGVPVVEPLTAAINLSVMLVRSSLRHSKLSYPKPSKKRRLR